MTAGIIGAFAGVVSALAGALVSARAATRVARRQEKISAHAGLVTAVYPLLRSSRRSWVDASGNEICEQVQGVPETAWGQLSAAFAVIQLVDPGRGANAAKEVYDNAVEYLESLGPDGDPGQQAFLQKALDGYIEVVARGLGTTA